MLPEVQEALSIMEFTITSPSAYKGNRYNWPMAFMLMKVLGGLCSLFANVFVILHQNNIEDVIKDFIAVGVINEIDNIIAATWTYEDTEEIIRETEIWINRDRLKKTDNEIIDLYSAEGPADEKMNKIWRNERELGLVVTLSNWKLYSLRAWMVIYRILRVFMEVFQFYFAPFIVTALLYLKAGPMDLAAWKLEKSAD